VSRFPTWNSDRQFPESAPLRLSERADAARDAFESLPICPIQRTKRLLESRALEHDRLVRLQLTEALRLPAHRGLTFLPYGFDNFGGGCKCFHRHGAPPPPDDLIDRAR
jgi:hypothetical protein